VRCRQNAEKFAGFDHGEVHANDFAIACDQEPAVPVAQFDYLIIFDALLPRPGVINEVPAKALWEISAFNQRLVVIVAIEAIVEKKNVLVKPLLVGLAQYAPALC
jgi:hypothetical protein